MTQKLVAEVSFSEDIRDRLPTHAFNAEAHLSAQDGPWSVRAELWSPPTEKGKSIVWLSFLSPNAPFAEVPLGSSFELRMGRTLIGQAALLVFPVLRTGYKENNFEDNPNGPVRSIASAAA